MNEIFVIVLHFFRVFSMYLAFLHILNVSYRLLYKYSTKKTEGIGQELKKWDCITKCDVSGCVT